MTDSFFFYDLETTGINPRTSRIVQFAGQRTDMDLNLIGDPVNVFIKLTPDILPDPDAVLITGITPQQTLADGITEAEFLKFFHEKVVKPSTVFIGYNNIRFDDEFMRFIHYRNFYDAYEWHWKDKCSRWDLLDVVRMTRALRPGSIKWPFAPDGSPTNRLESITKLNKLDHSHAHDALNDVLATIAVAKLIKSSQPELFEYLKSSRDKFSVKKLVQSSTPFVYTTNRYSSKFAHTSVAVQLAKHIEQDAALVYDLRYDPTPFLSMNTDQIIEAWQYSRDPDKLRLPVKTLKYNRCPTVAPLGVIKDIATQDRLGLKLETIYKHLDILKNNQNQFTENIAEAVSQMDKTRENVQLNIIDKDQSVDEKLYDGFIDRSDIPKMLAVRGSGPNELNNIDNFKDSRLRSLLPLYKARNYPESLDSEERLSWDKYISNKLYDKGPSSLSAKFFKRLDELSASKLSSNKQYLLEELRLYGESILPADVTD